MNGAEATFCTTITIPIHAIEAAAAKQREMREPHGDQDRRTEQAELDRDRKHLIVRIDRLLAEHSPLPNCSGIEPVPWPITGAAATMPSDLFQSSSRIADDETVPCVS